MNSLSLLGYVNSRGFFMRLLNLANAVLFECRKTCVFPKKMAAFTFTRRASLIKYRNATKNCSSMYSKSSE